jgi:hypothetical protein
VFRRLRPSPCRKFPVVPVHDGAPGSVAAGWTHGRVAEWGDLLRHLPRMVYSLGQIVRDILRHGRTAPVIDPVCPLPASKGETQLLQCAAGGLEWRVIHR